MAELSGQAVTGIRTGVIMDPIGNVPIFLSVTRRLSPKQRSRSALLAVVTAALVIAGFAVGGRQVLGSLDVSVPALQGAGGLLLLLVALQLLTSADDDAEAAPIDHVAVAMVPLGTPLLAGPGAIVAAIVFVQNSSTASERWSIAGALADTAEDQVAVISTAFAPGCDASLYWQEGQSAAGAFAAPDTAAEILGGSFIALSRGEAGELSIEEDGFAISLTETDWRALLSAMASTRCQLGSWADRNLLHQRFQVLKRLFS